MTSTVALTIRYELQLLCKKMRERVFCGRQLQKGSVEKPT